jgi:hypothetical protein
VLLVAALVLANCCLSGNGCYTPVAATAPAWDGLGEAPTDGTQPDAPKPKKHVRTRNEIIIGPLDAASTEANPKTANPKAHRNDEWEDQDAADRANEARLTKKLMICRDCLPAEPAHGDAADRATR